MSKAVLITGATGQQGGALIRALVAKSTNLTVLAVTRKADSPSATKLAELKNVKLVEGDFNDVPAMFKAAQAISPNIWGVFSVQPPQGFGNNDEVAQGIAMVDEALKYNVKQFVYGSVDRGGDSSYDRKTGVPHFATKYDVEHYIVDATKGTDMRYTFLRPVAYFDNFGQGFFAKIFVAAIRISMGKQRAIQYVDTRDIGYFGAEAFVNPAAFSDRAISIAGEELTVTQLEEVSRREIGKPMPDTFTVLGYALYYGMKEMRYMLDFFRDDGFRADIAAVRKEHPGLRTFADWLQDNKAKL